ARLPTLLSLDVNDRFEDRLRVVVDRLAAYEGEPLIQVEPLDDVGLPLVEIDRLGIDQFGRADPVHLREDAILSAALQDGNRVVGGDAKADAMARLLRLRPVECRTERPEKPFIGDRLRDLHRPGAEEALILRAERKLGG